jgi:hypothetical protein
MVWSEFCSGDCIASRPVQRRLMRMGLRSSLAAVVASVVFAVAWATCDQLAGLGVGGSSAAAGVLATVALGLTLWRTRPERPSVRRLLSAHARPNGLLRPVDAQPHDVSVEPTARPGERGRELPKKPTVTGRSIPHARDVPARERTRTLMTQHIQFIVDDAGIRVQRKRKTAGAEVWEEHLRTQWSAVTAIGFATGRNDPIVALYAWTAAGRPYHMADSRFLNHLEWTRLSELIAEATRGRLTLDVADRHNPRSVWPDW